jgi:hypothetical protein
MIYPGQGQSYAQVQPGGQPYASAVPNVRQPQIRAKGPDQPAPQPLPRTMPRPEQLGIAMPSPEQLGVTMPRPEQLGIARPSPPADSAAAPGVNWTATRARLDQMGATSFALSREADGYHFVILLATGKPNEAYHVEAKAATEVEAVEAGLKRAIETCR